MHDEAMKGDVHQNLLHVWQSTRHTMHQEPHVLLLWLIPEEELDWIV